MIKYIFSLVLIAVLSFSMTSCGNDGPDCDDEAALSQFLSESTSDYFTALQTFGIDPSDDNCKSLLNALDTFIEDIESISDCVPSADRAEFDTLLSEARQELTGLNCN